MQDSATLSASPSKEGHTLGYYDCECPCCIRMRHQGFTIARMQVNGAFDMIEKKITKINERLIYVTQENQRLMDLLVQSENEIEFLRYQLSPEFSTKILEREEKHMNR